MSATTDLSGAPRGDICFVSISEQIQLTPAQERFADRHAAMLCVKYRDGAVCVYSAEFDKTVRWIVDPRGRVLERKEFDLI